MTVACRYKRFHVIKYLMSSFSFMNALNSSVRLQHSSDYNSSDVCSVARTMNGSDECRVSANCLTFISDLPPENSNW